MTARLEHITPAAVRAAKALLGWANDELAARAGLSRDTVRTLIKSDMKRGTIRTLKAVVTALEDAGIAFIHDPETGAVGAVMRAKTDR